MIKYDDSGDFVARLRAQADIVSIVSEYVSLKKQGRSYVGCCPFHQEKTPSFNVSPEKGLFYCYGCQKGGNVFNFLMGVENVGFGEAVKLLATKLNVPLPQRERSEEEQRRERDREDIIRANGLARDFFRACLLKANLGKPAMAYLKNRGLSVEQIDAFGLGYAPDAWSKMSVALAGRGIADEVLVKAGLALPREQDGVYDRFRNRIMFPIENVRGQVIGFGGRVMDTSQPKYLNSPETLVFNKRKVLYNFHRAYTAIKKAGHAIVVEGYMDALSLAANGIENVVASLGTSFTSDQSRMLLHYAPEIIFAYDSDSAGQNATLRALSIVRSGGAVVRVASFPEGKDPDEVMRRQGTAVVRERIAAAAGLLEFQMAHVLQGADISDLAGKVAVVGKAVPYLALADNAVEVDVHIARLAETLGIDENSIRSELLRQKGRNTPLSPTVMHVRRNAGSRQNMAEDYILRQALESPERFALIKENLSPGYFQAGARHSLAEAIWKSYDAGQVPVPDELMQTLGDEAAQILSRAMLNEEPGADAEQALADCIKTVLLAKLNEEYELHRLRADEMSRQGNSDYMQELLNAQRIFTKINDITKSQ